MTPEKAVKRKVKAILEELGAYYSMTITGGYGNSGVPDFVICLHGRFIGIECKAGKNVLTALQEKNFEKIILSGGLTFVANERSVCELRDFLLNVDMKLI